MTTETTVQPVELPTFGMVDIVMRGKQYSVTPQHAKTLINKGAATLKV